MPKPTGNVPICLSSFIGHDHEQQDVAAILWHPDVRLLTLTGPGGAGKTRLALQAATILADTYPDSVWFVDLAPLRDPDLVLSTIALVHEAAFDQHR